MLRPQQQYRVKYKPKRYSKDTARNPRRSSSKERVTPLEVPRLRCNKTLKHRGTMVPKPRHDEPDTNLETLRTVPGVPLNTLGRSRTRESTYKSQRGQMHQDCGQLQVSNMVYQHTGTRERFSGQDHSPAAGITPNPAKPSRDEAATKSTG